MAKSLLQQNLESNPGAGLPVEYTGTAPIAVQSSIFQLTPYVTFVSPKGQAFASLSVQIPGLGEGDPVLIEQGAPPLKLNPFRFFLTHAYQHWSVVDNIGTIIRSTEDREVAKENPPGGGYWAEHIETVLFVRLPDRVVPARCTFKTTKTNAAHAAIAGLELASSPEFGDRSPEHKAALQMPYPWARVVTEVSLSTRTSHSSGFRYTAAKGIVKPSVESDWKLFAAFFSDPKNVELAQAVVAAHEDRKDQVKSKEE